MNRQDKTETWDNSLQKWEAIWGSPEWAMALRFLSLRQEEAVKCLLALNPSDAGEIGRAQGRAQVFDSFINGEFRKHFTEFLKEPK